MSGLPEAAANNAATASPAGRRSRCAVLYVRTRCPRVVLARRSVPRPRAQIDRYVFEVWIVGSGDFVEVPGFWDALEFVDPMVGEGDSGSGDEIFDGAGGEDLKGPCE
jgi:hypothetical protein